MPEKMDNDRKAGNDNPLIVYGTNWCPSSLWDRTYLEEHGIYFKWVDINADPEARAFVLAQTGGYASVPTLRFPDGEILIEPGVREIKRRFGGERRNVIGRVRSLFGV
ncbi:MAG: glutaredoxin domain-containing protein [Anaerolineae bacterium]